MNDIINTKTGSKGILRELLPEIKEIEKKLNSCPMFNKDVEQAIVKIKEARLWMEEATNG